MEKGDKGSTLTRMGVSGWMFLMVPTCPCCPGQMAVKWSLLLLLSTNFFQFSGTYLEVGFVLCSFHFFYQVMSFYNIWPVQKTVKPLVVSCCHFAGAMSMCYLKIDRNMFETTLNKLNEFYADAEALSARTYCENCFACLTAYIIYLCMDTHYEKVLHHIIHLACFHIAHLISKLQIDSCA